MRLTHEFKHKYFKKNHINKKGDILMTNKQYNKELFSFIEAATCSFTGIKKMKEILLENKFIELQENNSWNLEENKKYFITRNDASLIAFTIGKSESFSITCTHIDTPSFTIKPKNEFYEKNYLKINVMPYGGLLHYAWLDEPLSLAGRVIVKKNDTYYKEIIDIKKNLFCIPSVAIHQNEKANDSLNLNPQIDMIPIVALKNHREPIKKIIAKEINLKNKEEICDYDLFLYANVSPVYFGMENEMILAPRIDDLSCTFGALKGFINAKKNNNNCIFCAFNSEEIGSLTKEGADSSFLMDTLKRIAGSTKKEISILAHNSTILSADNTHATHPNHPGNSDITNEALLNKGIVISKDASSTTDSITSSIFKGICKKARVPFQDFVTKNDMTSGSTLTGISLRHVSIDSIDIGLGQLAMHGAKEIMGSQDAYYLYLGFKKFYETKITKEKDRIQLDS